MNFYLKYRPQKISELDLVSQGLSNGAVGYVLKPFDFEEFNSRIKELTAK